MTTLDFGDMDEDIELLFGHNDVAKEANMNLDEDFGMVSSDNQEETHLPSVDPPKQGIDTCEGESRLSERKRHGRIERLSYSPTFSRSSSVDDSSLDDDNSEEAPPKRRKKAVKETKAIKAPHRGRGRPKKDDVSLTFWHLKMWNIGSRMSLMKSSFENAFMLGNTVKM